MKSQQNDLLVSGQVSTRRRCLLNILALARVHTHTHCTQLAALIHSVIDSTE